MPSPLVTPALSDAVLTAMREAAEAEVLPRWRALTADEVRTKSAPWDLVTDADVLAERRITAARRQAHHGADLGFISVSRPGTIACRRTGQPVS